MQRVQELAVGPPMQHCVLRGLHGRQGPHLVCGVQIQQLQGCREDENGADGGYLQLCTFNLYK